MSNGFEHVKSGLIRSVLNGEDLSNDSIADAISLTEQHWEGDATNLDVPFELFSAREEYLEDAEYYFNVEGDIGTAIKCLRKYWSI